MGKLASGLKKKRRFPFEIAEFKLTLRRPTAYEIAKLGHDLSFFEIAARFVEDWGEVRESTYVKGGSSDLLEFSQEDWRALLEDRSELWEPIATEVLAKWDEHKAKREESEKNSSTG